VHTIFNAIPRRTLLRRWQLAIHDWILETTAKFGIRYDEKAGTSIAPTWLRWQLLCEDDESFGSIIQTDEPGYACHILGRLVTNHSVAVMWG
jgi:hypothetical protein